MAPDITALKGVRPIVSLTAYHAHTAAIADKYCDFLLVGDSLGMLAKRWTEHQDSDAAQKLITSHLRLVARIAMMMSI